MVYVRNKLQIKLKLKEIYLIIFLIYSSFVKIVDAFFLLEHMLVKKIV